MGPLGQQASRGKRIQECRQKYQQRRWWRRWRCGGRDEGEADGIPVHHPPEPVGEAQVHRRRDQDVRVVERPEKHPNFARVRQLRRHPIQERRDTGRLDDCLGNGWS